MALGDAARALGISPVELSALEQGKAQLATDGEWEWARVVLKAAKGG